MDDGGSELVVRSTKSTSGESFLGADARVQCQATAFNHLKDPGELGMGLQGVEMS
jgi:hypothetical protein